MTTLQMEYFLQAASLLNFTAAAEMLYMSQPTLSHQISNIENELGVKLFSRGNNTLRLTPAGKVLYKGLKDVLSNYNKLLIQVENINLGICGEFNVGLQEDLLLDEDTTAAIKKLKAVNSNVNINICKKDIKGLLDGLTDSSLDVAIMLNPFVHQPKKFLVKELRQEPFYVAISKASSQHLPDKINFDTFINLLDDFPLILLSQERIEMPICEAASGPLRELNRHGCHPLVTLVPSIDALQPHITAGLGIMITNRTHIVSTNQHVRLIELAFKENELNILPTFRRAVMWSAHITNPMIQEFVSVLNEYLENNN